MTRGIAPLVAGWRGRNRGLPGIQSGSSPAGTVTFPTTNLACRVYLAIGADLTQPPTSWSWTDISNYVRFTSGISTTQGRQDWTSTVRTSAGQLTLDNRDGRFSRRNPNSPYYGLLNFNTPIWATVDPGSGPITRMQMFVNEWPTRWDRSGKDSTVPIQCAGIMRRLQQGTVLKSTLRRRYLSQDEPTPVAYWPCEDGSDSTSVASGLAGGTPMTGTAVFTTGFGGSAGSLDLNATADNAVTATVTLADASGFQLECTAVSESVGVVEHLVDVVCGTLNSGLSLQTGQFDGQPHHLSVQFVQNGPDVTATAYRDGVLSAILPISGAVLGTSVNVFIRNASATTDLAHVAIYGFASMSHPRTRAAARAAYAGELATTRIRRLAAEEGVPMVCTSGVSQAMGPQTASTFMTLLRECEAVDGGVLYEINWGLGFQSLNDRTNQPVSFALDFAQRHIAVEPEPADDDQRLRNRWTVSRTGGSSATAESTDGPTGVNAVGLYDDSVELNVQSDDQLANQAGWRLHLSS